MFFALFTVVGLFALLKGVAWIKRDPIGVNTQNPYLFQQYIDIQLDQSMAQAARNMPAKPSYVPSFYTAHIKPVLDTILAFSGLLLLSPVFLVIVLAIVVDDPGPVFFTQKRVGKGKTFFRLHKFRSMKMSTPHDVPTHQLSNPEQYITRVGKFLRKTSLDELPQIWDIFRGKMSIIGPRPALWNQADLVAQREKYAANDVTPGLTGWAQINGRDALEIPVKAKLDGEYIVRQSFLFDCRCFWETIASVLKHEGVVEGGTGQLHKQEQFK